MQCPQVPANVKAMQARHVFMSARNTCLGQTQSSHSQHLECHAQRCWVRLLCPSGNLPAAAWSAKALAWIPAQPTARAAAQETCAAVAEVSWGGGTAGGARGACSLVHGVAWPQLHKHQQHLLGDGQWDYPLEPGSASATCFQMSCRSIRSMMSFTN